jgi:hypothetical protein
MNEACTGKEEESQEGREHQHISSSSPLGLPNYAKATIAKSEGPPVLIDALDEDTGSSEEEQRTWDKQPEQTGSEGVDKLKSKTTQSEDSGCLTPDQAEKHVCTARERGIDPLDVIGVLKEETVTAVMRDVFRALRLPEEFQTSLEPEVHRLVRAMTGAKISATGCLPAAQEVFEQKCVIQACDKVHQLG